MTQPLILMPCVYVFKFVQNSHTLNIQMHI